jgi:hypothetical protein
MTSAKPPNEESRSTNARSARVKQQDDGLFLYTIEDPQRGEVLGGIEWVGVGERDLDEFPSPDLLNVLPA